MFNERRTRGVQDILIAVVDGLTGLVDAIETAFPQTTVQSCIAHLLRNSLQYVSWKDRKLTAAALRPIYTAVNNDTPARKLPWLALRNTFTLIDARNRFAIFYGDRFTRLDHTVIR